MVSPRIEPQESQSLLGNSPVTTAAAAPREQTTFLKVKAFVTKYSWILFIVLGHCACAGSLTVVNKWALNNYDSAFTLTFVQLAFSAAVIQLMGWLKLVLTKI